MASTDSDMANSLSANPISVAGLQPLSCLRCAHRKVKCSRVYPCTTCTKQSVPCEFPPPKTEKRKRKAVSNGAIASDVQAKLDHYERLLKRNGIDPENSQAESHSPVAQKAEKPFRPTTKQEIPGRLVVNGKKSRYMEGNLWTEAGPIADELGNTASLLPESSEDEEEDDDQMPNTDHSTACLPLGLSPQTSKTLTGLFPSPDQFRRLWQIFLENVHPVTMLIHPPSARGALFDASRAPRSAARDVEALLFSVVTCAVVSLTRNRCIEELNEGRDTLLARFRLGTERALINAKYLVSSNLTVLQAFNFYLLSIRGDSDPRALWTLSGIAKRNGQRLGLHQQSIRGLKPFDVEMRRRLYNHIMSYDLMFSMTAGTRYAVDLTQLLAVPLPLNVNDRDLSPDMTEPPVPRTGATDMIFSRLRCAIWQLMSKNNYGKFGWQLGHSSSEGNKDHMSERTRAYEDAEKEIELGILRYCDPLKPIHCLAAVAARLALSKMKFGMLHPRQFYHANMEHIPQDKRDDLFDTGLKALEYANSLYLMPSLTGFQWHSQQQFQWACLIHVLDDLKTRPEGEDVERGWEQIYQTYELRPETLVAKRPKLPLYVAVNRLAVIAWTAREKRVQESGQLLETPAFVEKLRHNQELVMRRQSKSTSSYPTPSTGTDAQTPQSSTAYMPRRKNQPLAEGFGMTGLTGFMDDSTAYDGIDWTLFDTLITQEATSSFDLDQYTSMYDNAPSYTG